MKGKSAAKAVSKSSVGSVVQEWACNRHGTQPVAASVKAPKCKWCGNALRLNTWTLSGSD